jgi:hypothetical protein
MEGEIGICFNMAERPIKQLINAYFRKFASVNLVKTCKELGVNAFKIPPGYIKNGNFSTIIDTIPQSYLQHDSLYKIPPKTGEMRIIKDPSKDTTAGLSDEQRRGDIEFWLLYLELVNSTASEAKWNEKRCDYFAPDAQKVKGLIGNLLTMAHVVFNTLKKMNSEMEHLILETDKENVTLRIKNTHDIFKSAAPENDVIVFKFRRIQPDEPGGPLYVEDPEE